MIVISFSEQLLRSYYIYYIQKIIIDTEDTKINKTHFYQKFKDKATNNNNALLPMITMLSDVFDALEKEAEIQFTWTFEIEVA